MTEDLAQDGAFADYILVDARSLLALPDGLSPRAAALAEPLAVALHGITRAEIVEGDSVMVFGAGPIGALSIAALVAQGIGTGHGDRAGREPPAAGPRPRRRRGAAPVRARGVPAVGARSHRRATRCTWCSSARARRRRWRPASASCAEAGRMVMVGAGIEPPTFDGNRMLLNELTVCGSFVYDADGFERALELLASRRLPGRRADRPRRRAARSAGRRHGRPGQRAHRGQGDGRARPVRPTGDDQPNREAADEPSLLPVGQPPVQPRGHERGRPTSCRIPTGPTSPASSTTCSASTSSTMMTVDRQRLIYSCVHWDQFIFLIAEDEPMRCPRMDHYGFAVGTLDELVAARDRAVAFRDAGPARRPGRPERRRPGRGEDPLDLRALPAAHDVRAAVLGVHRRDPALVRRSGGLDRPAVVGEVERLRRDDRPLPVGVGGVVARAGPATRRARPTSSRSCSTTSASPSSAASAPTSTRPNIDRLAGGRAALPQLPHHRAVLADPGLPADRAQPPLGRRGPGHRPGHRVPRLRRPHPDVGRDAARDAGARTATPPTRWASGTSPRRRTCTSARRGRPGRSGAASSASTASSAARRTSSSRRSPTTTTGSRRPARPTTATT